MAVSGQGLEFAWYRYTDNGGGHWAMRVDNAWGTAAANGFAAYNAADNVWPKSKRYRRRAVIGVDSTTGRKTTMPVGSSSATVYALGQTFNRYVRGLQTAVTFTVVKLIGENKPASNPMVIHPTEYSEAS